MAQLTSESLHLLCLSFVGIHLTNTRVTNMPELLHPLRGLQ